MTMTSRFDLEKNGQRWVISNMLTIFHVYNKVKKSFQKLNLEKWIVKYYQILGGETETQT